MTTMGTQMFRDITVHITPASAADQWDGLMFVLVFVVLPIGVILGLIRGAQKIDEWLATRPWPHDE